MAPQPSEKKKTKSKTSRPLISHPQSVNSQVVENDCWCVCVCVPSLHVSICMPIDQLRLGLFAANDFPTTISNDYLSVECGGTAIFQPLCWPDGSIVDAHSSSTILGSLGSWGKHPFGPSLEGCEYSIWRNCILNNASCFEPLLIRSISETILSGKIVTSKCKYVYVYSSAFNPLLSRKVAPHLTHHVCARWWKSPPLERRVATHSI